MKLRTNIHIQTGSTKSDSIITRSQCEYLWMRRKGQSIKSWEHTLVNENNSIGVTPYIRVTSYIRGLVFYVMDHTEDQITE
ncbi:MAG: hypothetical protein R1F52_04455 [Candidatus Nitrosoabyssus spongiisocia]|nr:MAG: hypothetical protein R1F52_04455 [Nitrosopumilaceae archaeon AB1(1)]